METIFKKKIKELGLSYRQLAKLMGGNGAHRHICLISNGRRNPSQKWRLRFIETINGIQSGRTSVPKIARGRPCKISTKQN